MIFPRSAVELSSPGFPRSPFCQMGAVFASHCCDLPKVREQPQKGVSVSFLSILGCSTSGWRDCMGLDLPGLLLSSLNPSSVQICFPNNIPTALAHVYGFFLCSPYLLLLPLHCTRTRMQPIDPCGESFQWIFLHFWIALVLRRHCPYWTANLNPPVPHRAGPRGSTPPHFPHNHQDPLPVPSPLFSGSWQVFPVLQTHKSWCCHSPLQDSVQCTIHNLSERQELITSPSLLLEQLHSFSVYLYQMFQERHRGSVPDEVHTTMIKSPRLILDVLELLLNLLQPNIKEFVTSAALHLFTRDWRDLFEDSS